jgi:hypothetical protein
MRIQGIERAGLRDLSSSTHVEVCMCGGLVFSYLKRDVRLKLSGIEVAAD